MLKKILIFSIVLFITACIDRDTGQLLNINYDNGDIYLGEHKDSIPQGEGVYTFDNGNKYVGEFFKGKRSGNGVYTCLEYKYSGDFKNNLPNGIGEVVWSDGSTYKGECKDDKAFGRGELYLANGDKYIGDFVNDSLTGKGDYTWANGHEYVGDLKGGIMHGQGTYRIPADDNNPEEYWTGRFQNGFISGQAKWFVDNQLRYEGEFQNDLENGYGRYYTKDLQYGYYEGEFKDGEKHGIGFDTTATHSFRGEFVKDDYFKGTFSGYGYSWQGDFGYCEEYKTSFDGEDILIPIPQGYGIYSDDDGTRFIGKMICWAKDSGQYICINGDQYVGQWVKDSLDNEMFYGKGIYIDKDSSKYEKEFAGDEWQKIKKE